MTIGERIRYLRKIILNIKSCDSFGKEIGLSRSNIANIETGRVSVTNRVISDICKTFSINENWLRNGGSDEDIFIGLTDREKADRYVDYLISADGDVFADLIVNFMDMYNSLDDYNKAFLNNFGTELVARINKNRG